MILSPSYRVAFFVALALHVIILTLMLLNNHKDSKIFIAQQPEIQTIKATSVDNQAVTQTLNRLKKERLLQQQKENERQQALLKQAEDLKNQRVREQHRLETLKNETAKLAIAHQKQVLEEQAYLKKLANQKLAAEKRQLELQRQQQQEAEKLANLKKQKADELIREKQNQEAKQRLIALNAAKAAQTSGEVDRYKALIITAISQRWILPENVNGSLSCQFRIRLAPDGSVLDVTLARSSGDPIMDRSAQSAIYKASPLPVPNDPNIFAIFREISLTVRPESARG